MSRALPTHRKPGDPPTGLTGLYAARNPETLPLPLPQPPLAPAKSEAIVILDDSDVKQMLAIRSLGGDPADLIRQKIEDFRLSF